MKYKMPCIKDIVTYMCKKKKKNRQKQTHKTKQQKKNEKIKKNKKKTPKKTKTTTLILLVEWSFFRYLWNLVQKPFQTSFMECFLSLSIFYLIRQTVPN